MTKKVHMQKYDFSCLFTACGKLTIDDEKVFDNWEDLTCKSCIKLLAKEASKKNTPLYKDMKSCFKQILQKS